jgi:predicted glycosyltransferase
MPLPGASISVGAVAGRDSQEPQTAKLNFSDRVGSDSQKKIWIDLDNSPHVPFFLPIIEEIERRGHEVFLTARNSYQVCDLLNLHGVSARVIGDHWGKNRTLKVIGTCVRTIQLMPLLIKEKPDLAVSHGSRAQLLASFALGIPKVVILDYEFTAGLGPIHADWIFTPDLIPDSPKIVARNSVAKYPGLKEDVYVTRLKPDPSVRTQLGLKDTDLVVIVRPPATEAHYHNPESEMLFDATLDFLMRRPEVRVVLLPRNEKQAQILRRSWDQWIKKNKIVIPEQAVDGINLIWASDLVISGGGTMNREAAALGVPVYSIFRGRIGAVDRYLADSGRMTLLETVEEVRTNIVLRKRVKAALGSDSRSAACRFLSEGIISIAERQGLSAQR